MKKSESFSLVEALETLENLEKSFHEPNLNLEESIKKHAEAVKLAKEIVQYLEHAENELEKVDIASLSSVNES